VTHTAIDMDKARTMASNALGTDLPGRTRRQVLVGGGAAAAGLVVARKAPPASAHESSTSVLGSLGAYPFTLGVASGEPLPDGVVFWTRLAPDPLAGGGVPARSWPVIWEVSTDERFRRIVKRGKTVARPESAHSVHVDVRGLEPARWYWYRFQSGLHLSPVGRTRTAPAANASPATLRFALASCQDWQNGHFTAYDDMAEQDLDFAVATEFVGTSISSDFPADFIPAVAAALPDNPHVKDFDGLLRGYVVARVDQQPVAVGLSGGCHRRPACLPGVHPAVLDRRRRGPGSAPVLSFDSPPRAVICRIRP
jgi:phosphodiesterase/alkaline phosphatase D-like protein